MEFKLDDTCKKKTVLKNNFSVNYFKYIGKCYKNTYQNDVLPDHIFTGVKENSQLD